jgi:Fe-S cluster biogenesis protein NfuA
VASSEKEENLQERVQRVLGDEVGPALEMDGTRLEVIEVAEGVVRLRLGGVCGGCPSTIMAVINGIEQELRQRIPEIEYLEAVP